VLRVDRELVSNFGAESRFDAGKSISRWLCKHIFELGVRLFSLVSVLTNTQSWIPAEERK